MREFGLITANYALFTLTTLTLAALQSSFWLQIFGYFPSPHIWIPVLVYWTLHRPLLESLVMVYLVTFVIAALSGMPLGLLLLVHMALFVVCQVVKERFYGSGSLYFMLISGGLSGLFPWLHLMLSWTIEANPITDFQFFDWIMRALLTTLVAMPLYRMFAWFDRVTHKELTAETGNPSL